MKFNKEIVITPMFSYGCSFIVTGDSLGHIRFYDQRLKLLNWYQDFKLGPINSISFAFLPDFYRTLGK